MEIVGRNHPLTWDNEAVRLRSILEPLTCEEVGTMILDGRQLVRAEDRVQGRASRHLEQAPVSSYVAPSGGRHSLKKSQ